MNKTELVSEVANLSKLSKAQAENAVNAIFASITQSLEKGEEVRLVGFGTFKVADRAATEGRNPRTGEAIKIAATRRPRFAAGKSLVDAVAGAKSTPSRASGQKQEAGKQPARK